MLFPLCTTSGPTSGLLLRSSLSPGFDSRRVFRARLRRSFAVPKIQLQKRQIRSTIQFSERRSTRDLSLVNLLRNMEESGSLARQLRFSQFRNL